MIHALPVLMYHSISRFRHHLCVSPERFEEHCRALAAAGWRGISLEEAEKRFLKNKALPKKSCFFTFDDGYLDNYVYAEPLLRRHGHHGAIFPVLGFVEDRPDRRPNMESEDAAGVLPKELAGLDARKTSVRSGRRVANIVFCSWAELRYMENEGNLCAAPHSMDHARVVVDLEIKKLYWPRSRSGFFAVPPHEALYGFPAFKLGHALADRAYALNPELFDLIRAMVPQTAEEAKAFLSVPANVEAVMSAVRALPWLGELESEEARQERVLNEFVRCREFFKEKMGRDPISFCWPWGSFTKSSLELARQAGFRLFFTTAGKPSMCSSAQAVYRIPVRDQSANQLLQRLRFASGAFGEGLAGLFRADPL